MRKMVDEETNRIKNLNTFAENLEKISIQLRNGLSVEELERERNIPVSYEWNVGDLVAANLKTGYIRLYEGKFLTTLTSVNVRITLDEEEVLMQRAVEAGVTPNELAGNILAKNLRNR